MRRLWARALLVWVLAGMPATLAAQAATGVDPDWIERAPVSAEGLRTDASSVMQMLYERTLFRVDVLHLTLSFGDETAAELEGLVDGRAYDPEIADAVIATALGASDALVRSRFLRGISLAQYLGGIRENLAHAHAAGLITATELDAIVSGLETEYVPLRNRGVRAGDTVWYRIRGDRVEVVFQGTDGGIVLRIDAEGPEHRRAILGGYLAPASDFREPLVRSLFRTAAP